MQFIIFLLGFILFVFIITIFLTIAINRNKPKKLENYTLQITNDNILNDISEKAKSLNLLTDKSKNLLINMALHNSAPLDFHIKEIKSLPFDFDSDINSSLNQLIDTLNNLNNYLKEHTSKANEIKVMADYYICELVKNLNIYLQIYKSNKNSIQLGKIKPEIIKTIGIINNAFSIILAEFYDNMALSVSSSLEAVNQSIKLKGYIK